MRESKEEFLLRRSIVASVLITIVGLPLFFIFWQWQWLVIIACMWGGTGLIAWRKARTDAEEYQRNQEIAEKEKQVRELYKKRESEVLKSKEERIAELERLLNEKEK